MKRRRGGIISIWQLLHTRTLTGRHGIPLFIVVVEVAPMLKDGCTHKPKRTMEMETLDRPAKLKQYLHSGRANVRQV